MKDETRDGDSDVGTSYCALDAVSGGPVMKLIVEAGCNTTRLSDELGQPERSVDVAWLSLRLQQSRSPSHWGR